MKKIVVLGSSALFPLPRTIDNRFSDYRDIAHYQKKFPLHNDPVCLAAKRGGKDRRTRSSVALVTDKCAILFDAGPDIRHQLKKNRVPWPDAVCITHAHIDASAGLVELLKEIPVYSEKSATLSPGKEFSVGTVTICPFRVFHAKNVPTVGFRVRVPRKKRRPFIFVYATDLASLVGTKSFFQDSDIAFVDGSILHQDLPGHKAITHQLRLYKQWRIKKVYFTHIGHRTLPHEELRSYTQSRYANADVAYDDMIVPIT